MSPTLMASQSRESMSLPPSPSMITSPVRCSASSLPAASKQPSSITWERDEVIPAFVEDWPEPEVVQDTVEPDVVQELPEPEVVQDSPEVKRIVDSSDGEHGTECNNEKAPRWPDGFEELPVEQHEITKVM